MSEVIDLNELVGDPKKLKIGGPGTGFPLKELKLPGDIPIDTFLEITSMEKRLEDDTLGEEELITEMRDKISGLFTLMDPNFTWPPQLGVRSVSQLIGRVYREKEDPTPAPAEPTPAKAKAKASTKRTRGASKSSRAKPKRSAKPKA